jgi:hypothetical protein
MWRQRAPEEHEEINLSFCDAGADLLIASQRPAFELLH